MGIPTRNVSKGAVEVCSSLTLRVGILCKDLKRNNLYQRMQKTVKQGI